MTKATDNVDRSTQRRAKRKKKQKRSWIVKGIATAFFLYLLLSVVFSFRSGLSTTIALKGSVEEEVLVDGYVFREQSMVNAPAMGYLECRVSEGDRVTEGQILGYIYTGEYDAQRSQQIREIGDRIARLESTVAENTYAGNGVMVEQKIAVAARDLSDLRQSRDMSITAEHKEALNLLIEKKHAMNAGGSTDTEAELAQLRNQLQELENSTGGGKFALAAPSAGVFSSKIDGMEGKLSPEQLSGLTPSYLKELDKVELERKETVVQNEPVCKVVNNYGWYFAANMPAEKAEGLEVGQSVSLRFFNLSDAEVQGTISAISQEEKGEVAVTVYTNRYVDGIYSTSRASAEIVTTSAEGIKLPVKSIYVKDGQAGVYVLRLDVARFVPVNVRYKNEEWAIVSAVTDIGADYKLQIYDEVIVEAKNLEDGKVVR